jgi:hypothetical protein
MVDTGSGRGGGFPACARWFSRRMCARHPIADPGGSCPGAGTSPGPGGSGAGVRRGALGGVGEGGAAAGSPEAVSRGPTCPRTAVRGSEQRLHGTRREPLMSGRSWVRNAHT